MTQSEVRLPSYRSLVCATMRLSLCPASINQCSRTPQFSVVRTGTPLKASPAVESNRVCLPNSAAPHMFHQTKALSLPPKSKFSRFDGYPDILLQYVAIPS